MLRIVILSIFVAQLQGLQQETSIDKKAKTDNQEEEQVFEFSSHDAKFLPDIIGFIEEEGDTLLNIAGTAGVLDGGKAKRNAMEEEQDQGSRILSGLGTIASSFFRRVSGSAASIRK